MLTRIYGTWFLPIDGKFVRNASGRQVNRARGGLPAAKYPAGHFHRAARQYLFARHPDWPPIFDMNGPRAVRTRRHMLDRAAADRMLVEAYHFPFPAGGHMAKTAAGFELLPVMWRPL